jgi:transposase-like protein
MREGSGLAQSITSVLDKDKTPRTVASPSREDQQTIKERVVETVSRAVSQVLEQTLGDEVDILLGRVKSQRRDLADPVEVKAICHRCRSHQRHNFYRDGKYRRSLLTGPAYVSIRVPRLSCICGGTVGYQSKLFAPHQRIWFDMQELARQLAGLCLSLRDSVEVLGAENKQPLSISTINGLVNEAAVLAEAFRSGSLGEIPAVVALDGVWVKLLVETDREKTDKLGRCRHHKRRKKVPILVAYGIDPRTGQKRLLDWELGEGEDQESWQRLLERLEKRGLRGEQGLRLFIHDGSYGLEAAFGMVDFGEGVRRQRCIFHKLRNVAKAVQAEEGMSRSEKRQRRKEVLQGARAVYAGQDRGEIEERLRDFDREWREREPDAVLALRRNFETTLVYLDIQAEARQNGEEWALRYLRTTSSLERVNRALRQKFRQVVIFHSEKGLKAAVQLVIAHRGLSGQSSGCWMELVEESLMAA